MSADPTERQQRAIDQAQRDLMIAAAVAAALMLGTALFAPAEHLWGVALGAMIAIANLSALSRISAQLLGQENPPASVAVKAVLKVLALMAVVVAVLLTRPQLALGLCIGIALPALAGIILLLRGTTRRAQAANALSNGERD